jgi:hypothetical protein
VKKRPPATKKVAAKKIVTRKVAVKRAEHWWEDHPPADPVAEPLYAEALSSHLLQGAT